MSNTNWSIFFIGQEGLGSVRNVEQRANMKFCFKLDKTADKTYKMLPKNLGKTIVTNKTVFKWFGRFREGNESLEDDESCWQNKTSRRVSDSGSNGRTSVYVLYGRRLLWRGALIN